MDASLAAIIGAAVGSGVTGLFGFIAILFQRRSDERRQVRELSVQIAIKEWEAHVAGATNRGGEVFPLAAYLMHSMKLISVIDGSISSPQDVVRRLKEVMDITNAATEEINRQESTRNKDAQQGAARNRA
jgi:hypothetical protein